MKQFLNSDYRWCSIIVSSLAHYKMGQEPLAQNDYVSCGGGGEVGSLECLYATALHFQHKELSASL